MICFSADEAATLRVTNLSEDAMESDIQELFRNFGPLARVYLAKDKLTNQSKVSFVGLTIIQNIEICLNFEAQVQNIFQSSISKYWSQ